MKIGQLAARTGTPIETIRYYERQGLLADPVRSAGNYRVYDEREVTRLSFIRYCRGLDMGLDEIRVLLAFRDAPGENCAAVNALLDEHIGHVEHRIRELRELDRELRSLRALCVEAREAARCGILRQLDRATPAAAGPGRGTHVAGVHGMSRARKTGS